MIEARALVSINFLNLSENYDFMSRWLGVYDKYAKLLKGSSDAVVKDGSGKIRVETNPLTYMRDLTITAIIKVYQYDEVVQLSLVLSSVSFFGKYHTNLTMRFLDLQQESCFQQQFWD